MSLGIFKGCAINLEGKELTIDLVPLVIQHFHVILEMHWLSTNYAVIDYDMVRMIFPVLNQ